MKIYYGEGIESLYVDKIYLITKILYPGLKRDKSKDGDYYGKTLLLSPKRVYMYKKKSIRITMDAIRDILKELNTERECWLDDDGDLYTFGPYHIYFYSLECDEDIKDEEVWE